MDIRTLTQRLEKLESLNKRLRVLAIIALAACVLPWVLGAARDTQSQTLQGRRLVLFDAQGHLRAFIGPDEENEDRVGLYLYDRTGKKSASLYVKEDQAALSLYGSDNKERARFALNDRNVDLTFYDLAEQKQMRLSLDGTASSLGLGGSDEYGRHVAGLTSNGNHASLYFDTRPNGSSNISMGNREIGSHVHIQAGTGNSHLLLRSQDGQSRIQLEPADDQPSIKMNASTHVPSLMIFDLEGNMISHLP